MINKIKNKLRSTSGMSLGELLIAVLIMLLATSTVVSTIQLANKQYKNSMRNSEANLLYSTLSSIITGELSYATEVYVYPDGEVRQFQGNDYQERDYLSSFATKDGQLVFANADSQNEDGVIDEYRELISKSFYQNDLMAEVKKCEFNKQGQYFRVNLVISDESGSHTKTIINKTFDVRSINGLTDEQIKEVSR